jgi:HEAT repeat protein
MPLFGPPNIQKLYTNHDVKGLINALGYPEASIRANAAKALASLGEDALQALRQGLESSSTSIRCGAAIALAHMDIPQAVPVLIEGLENSSHFVRMDCVRGLGRMQNGTAIPILHDHYRRETDPEIRIAVLEALTLLGNSEGAQLLFGLLESSDHNLRMAAAQSFSRLGEPGIEYLLHGLKSHSSTVRYACANSLGKNQTSRAIIPLIQALVDDDEGVQKASQEALIKYGSQAAQYLSQALRTKDKRLQQAVSRTLKKIPDLAEPQLIAQFSDPSLEIRELIIQVLGEIGTNASVEPLAEFIQHPDPSLRYAAVDALARLGLDEVVPYLTLALSDPDDYIFNAAKSGLTKLAQNTRNPQVAKSANTILQQISVEEIALSDRQKVNSLVRDLIVIAGKEGFLGEFGTQFDSFGRHIYAREIGMELFKLGGHRLMQIVWGKIHQQIDPQSSADLMINWKEIGGWNAV